MLDAAIASELIDEGGMAGLVSIPTHGPHPVPADLDDAIEAARAALLGRQEADGHWVFELEADATIPAEYVLLCHYLDRVDPGLEAAIAVYLRERQSKPGEGDHGGWPLFHNGAFNVSASVKAYFALKMIGDDPDAPHMVRARNAILAAGGAERSNVFTRIQLALFGQVPWRAVPAMPLEIMLLPQWFPFNLDRISYWSRTVLVPLLVLMHRQPSARNPRGIHIAELFATPPEQIRDWIRGPYRSPWGALFKRVDAVVRAARPLFPKRPRARAEAAAIAFVTERLNGEDGLGAIYPAMANAVMMFDALGYAPDHPDAATAWGAVQKLVTVKDGLAYVQPCLSPVWDTSLAGHAVAEADSAAARPVDAANAWLRDKQVTDVVGDWARARPDAPPGGWAFQYENAHYPDVDDTAVVGMLLHRQGGVENDVAVARAAAWVVGMQGRDGGWGAFDADNNHAYLNHIPFADHGALLDPSTADVTARCVSFLSQVDPVAYAEPIARAVAWLRAEQEPDGSWFGRWGTNYIYGTWSVLCALNAAGLDHADPAMRRAVDFLVRTQRSEGGWGEDNDSYAGAPRGEYDRSNPSQTAWALLGLMAAGEAESASVARGIAWLAGQQTETGEWEEAPYTAVGFPRVFYLRYHGYRLYFPLMALARFRTLKRGNDKRVAWGF